MTNANVSFQNIAVKYGLLVGLAHIAYFLLMRLLSLINIVELSYLSGLFLVAGIVMAISKFKRIKGGVINYFEGLGIGVVTAFVSSLMLALFLVLFVTLFDDTFVDSLSASALFPEGLSILTMFWITVAHGTWPGFFIAFIAMQWFKRQDHTTPKKI
ncbi:DUF4199 domain-containing protein [Pontibacter oryzae]|uniref:DUF4199 domain-containing protein n=1 Tax=Pontibacter oryzae TaxID=2304593 RepID=A0A399SF46_9BACT|nr:DUF4199 domain-containing protein [Pontibacter oryzae]RIJ41818.1 DUF4199 domain-containing protein [Pontibacter oryzae]